MDLWLAWIALAFFIGSLMALFVPAIKLARQGGISKAAIPKRAWILAGPLLLITVTLILVILFN